MLYVFWFKSVKSWFIFVSYTDTTKYSVYQVVVHLQVYLKTFFHLCYLSAIIDSNENIRMFAIGMVTLHFSLYMVTAAALLTNNQSSVSTAQSMLPLYFPF
jgi:hypothetical protein